MFDIADALAAYVKLPGDLRAGQPRKETTDQDHIGLRELGIPAEFAPLRHDPDRFRRITT